MRASLFEFVLLCLDFDPLDVRDFPPQRFLAQMIACVACAWLLGLEGPEAVVLVLLLVLDWGSWRIFGRLTRWARWPQRSVAVQTDLRQPSFHLSQGRGFVMDEASSPESFAGFLESSASPAPRKRR